MGKKELALKDKIIVIVLYSFNLGGAERQALLLGRHLLHEEGARVQVWGFFNPGRVVEICKEYALPWQIIPIKLTIDTRMGIIKGAALLARSLRRAHADILLPYLTPPNILCGLAWPWTGAQLCVWNQRNGGIERVEPMLERWAARLTPSFISNSSQGADFLARTFKIESKRIRVIPNAVDLDKCAMDRTTWRRTLKVGADSFLACMLANLHQGKDHATLVKAWQWVVRELAKVGRGAVLVLAGRSDTTDQYLRDLSQELGINEYIRFLGAVNDISGLLKSVDVGVLTSRYTNYEGCPNAVLEYMASGLAVVGTDIPGIRDVVDVSAFPFLVPIGDSGALADRIIQLAVSPELRRKLGEVNRQRAMTEFTLRGMCGKTVDFIKESLG